MNIVKLLDFEEGFRSEPYLCSEGYVTIGIGERIGSKNQPLSDFKLITTCKGAAYAQLEFKLAGITANLSNEFEFFDDLNECRQAVLISMAYQMGVAGLLMFERMLKAIKAQCWNDAAHEGLDSRWAKQTPARAHRQMKTLLTGTWSEYDLA